MKTLQTIELTVPNKANVKTEAVCFGNWAVHLDLRSDVEPWAYTVTHIPTGLAAAVGVTERRGLWLAEEAQRRFPSLTDNTRENREMMRVLFVGHRPEMRPPWETEPSIVCCVCGDPITMCEIPLCPMCGGSVQ